MAHCVVWGGGGGEGGRKEVHVKVLDNHGKGKVKYAY